MQVAVGPLATYIFQGDSGQTVIFGHIEYSGGRLCIETNVRISKINLDYINFGFTHTTGKCPR